jgi:hypothetical protein
MTSSKGHGMKQKWSTLRYGTSTGLKVLRISFSNSSLSPTAIEPDTIRMRVIYIFRTFHLPCTLRVVVFWLLMSCSDVGYQRFGGPCRLLQHCTLSEAT